MADLADVQQAIAELIASAVASAQLDLPVKVYPGWPQPQSLAEDLGTEDSDPKALHVTVYSLPGEHAGQRMTEQTYHEAPLPTPSYALTSTGQAITVTGAAPAPYRKQNIAVFLSGHAYVYQAQAGDSPAAVANGLLALVAVDYPAASTAGAVLTVPDAARIGALRVGGYATASKVVGSSAKGFQITVWANNHARRTELARIVGPLLRDITRLTLVDGSLATLFYRSQHDTDKAQRQSAYRRDFLYTVDYAETVTLNAPEIVATETEYRAPTGATIITTEA